MKDRTCCFTGHRKLPTEKLNKITSELEKTVIGLIADGYRFFGTGGALGFDTVAAQTVIRLKDKYPKIRLILVLPCTDQAKFWNEDDSREYERIKKLADKTVYTSEKYYNGCMAKRNRHLVDNSSVCVAYLTQSGGGTAYTVEYANKHGLKVINIAENL
mgnify:FL=1